MMNYLNKGFLVTALALALSACSFGSDEQVSSNESADIEQEVQKLQAQAEVLGQPEVSSDIVEDIILDSFDTMKTDQENGVVVSGTISKTLPGGWKRINAKSVRVIDGDTVEILVEGQQSERIRLIGIDAPESKQEYGDISTDSLRECVADKPVSIIYKERDQYDRILGKVMAGNTDCNFFQVATGSAWHYKRYADQQPNDDKLIYSDAEKIAKSYSKGLWLDPEALEPWEFRKANKR